MSRPRRSRAERGRRSVSFPGNSPGLAGITEGLAGVLRSDSDGERFAAPPAAAVERLAARPGAHADSKAVLVQPLAIPGPVGRFHEFA